MGEPAQLAHIGLGAETAWGTGVAPTIFVPATKDINIEIARIRLEGPHATVAQLKSDAGRKSVRGGMGGVPGYTEVIGYLLKALLGAPSTSGVGPYTHTFKADTASVAGDYPRPPYSLQWTADGVTRRYVGGQLGQIQFNQPANDYLKLDLDWIFKDNQDGIAAATPTFPTDAVFGFRDLAVKRGGVDLGIRVEEAQITINNNLEAVEATGADTIAAVVLGTVTAEAQLTLEFNDAAIYNDFIGDTANSYEFVWTKGTKSLNIKFYRAVIASHSDPIPASGRLTAVATLAAELDPAGFVDVTLVNDTASY